MPGSTGFSLIAMASRNRKISGGVIADAIGAGKTVVSISLIAQGLKASRASRAFPRKSGATAVVVPSALVEGDLAEGTLVMPSAISLPMKKDYVCVYPHARADAPSVQAFRTHFSI